MAQIGQNIKQLYFLLFGRNPHFLLVVLRNPGVEPTARQLITDLTFPFGSWFSGEGFHSGRFPPRPAPPGVSPRPPSRHCALRSWPRGRGRRSSASHSVLVTGESSAHGASVPPCAECGVPRPRCHVHAGSCAPPTAGGNGQGSPALRGPGLSRAPDPSQTAPNSARWSHSMFITPPPPSLGLGLCPVSAPSGLV